MFSSSSVRNLLTDPATCPDVDAPSCASSVVPSSGLSKGSQMEIFSQHCVMFVKVPKVIVCGNVGYKVWKKNHVLSNAAEAFAAKLAPAYVLCTLHRVISPLVYQFVDKDGKNVGKYHIKDLKRYRGSKDEDHVNSPHDEGRRESQKLEWTEEADIAFNKLKESSVSAPILATPDFSKLFTIQCDASDVSVGCVLTQVIVPKSKRSEVFESCHADPQSAHLGVFQTLNRLRELYYFPRMLQEVKKYVRKCNVCAAQKVENSARPGLMGQPKKVHFPWQYVSVDILGQLPRSKDGFSYLLMVSDYFTKYSLLHPLKKATDPLIEKFLEDQVFLIYGAPQILACDNGVQFTGHVFRRLAGRYEVKIFYNCKYHPQVNAVELVNRVVGAAIRSYLKNNDHRSWDREVHKIAFAIRTAVHEGSFHGRIQPPGDISFEEDRRKYGEEIDKLSDLYLDVRSRLSGAYVENSRQYNLRKRPGENYQVGDKVWKKNHVLSNAAGGLAAKLAPAYVLCTVHRVILPLVYQLVDKDGKNVGKYHMKDLKRYRGSEDENQ
ncbi:hypothetical protein JTB14_018674 [Gonioctena quinquepunctata]|nr:hypothetical protein JTB14_018674 [Gonioctena quinquepunctata]